MRPNFNPQKGDPVRVRLQSGKIVSGEYERHLDPKTGSKDHLVNVAGGNKIASRSFAKSGFLVRFVYPLERMSNEQAKNIYPSNI